MFLFLLLLPRTSPDPKAHLQFRHHEYELVVQTITHLT